MAVGEWDQRQLCPDGACVGVIGPEGTCKVCGRAAQNWGDERKRGLIDPPDDEDDEGDDDDDDDEDEDEVGDDDGDDDDDDDDGDDDDDDDDGDEDGDDDEPPDHAIERAGGPPPEWGARQLCQDGGCIGVIGSDGRCKVCGRTAESPVASGAVVLSASASPDAEPRAACPDASCKGAIGPDGHCDVCGKVAA